MDYLLIGKHIRGHRRRRQLSQERLAEMIEVSPTYIGTIERAQKHPSLATLVKIANVLETTVDSLLMGNLHHDAAQYHEAITTLLLDCTPPERHIIYLIIESLKAALREVHQQH